MFHTGQALKYALKGNSQWAVLWAKVRASWVNNNSFTYWLDIYIHSQVVTKVCCACPPTSALTARIRVSFFDPRNRNPRECVKWKLLSVFIIPQTTRQWRNSQWIMSGWALPERTDQKSSSRPSVRTEPRQRRRWLKVASWTERSSDALTFVPAKSLGKRSDLGIALLETVMCAFGVSLWAEQRQMLDHETLKISFKRSLGINHHYSSHSQLQAGNRR